MAFLPFAVAAVQTGLKVGSYLKNRGKKGSANMLDIPEYKPSPYDAKSSAQLYDIYSRRAAGQDVGFAKEDMETFRAEAIDSSSREGEDFVRRSMAGRGNTGGITTGGTNAIRDRALTIMGQARSKSLRDVAIRNAVLKRQETTQGIAGLHDFLDSERAEAGRRFKYEMDRLPGLKENRDEAERVEAYNQARRASDFDFGAGMVEDVIGGTGPVGDVAKHIGSALKTRRRSISNYR